MSQHADIMLPGRPVLPWAASGFQEVVATKACHVPDTPEDIRDTEVTERSSSWTSSLGTLRSKDPLCKCITAFGQQVVIVQLSPDERKRTFHNR